MTLSPIILIVAAEEAKALKTEPGFEQDIRVFADTEAFKALEAIARARPRVVVLGRAFVGTARGAELINAIRADHALANCQIRVLGQASDYLHLASRRAEAGLAPGTAVPGEPLPPDYLGTRLARRWEMRADLEARLNGEPATLVDLSETGAQVTVPVAVRPKERVRLALVDSEQRLHIAGSVVWASLERSRELPHYRAGLHFIDADPEAVEAFSARHRQH